jgi:MoaA/NifB/PqqE/SkfB family radical SAM enzyme
VSLRAFVKDLAPKLVNYRLARAGLLNPTTPITFTFSVTAACQSLCKTCNIGALYLANPKSRKDDLSLDEIEKIFKSIGHIHFFNISGGEPFLRKDLPQIVGLACRYLTPRMVHTPTNGFTPKHIQEATREILQIMKEYDPTVPFTVKPSIDGVGEKHDWVRGLKGNFVRLEETFKRLKVLQQEYPNLHVEAGTVVSKYNINDIEEIADYVHKLGIESYRNEVAEERSEFDNIGGGITPSAEEYRDAMIVFSRKIRDHLGGKRQLAKITESFRLVYYDIAARILAERRQVIPCYGGITNVQMNYKGDLWPCCTLGYDQPLGNLREANYEFWKVFHSRQANTVRQFIKDEKCHCPLANQYYSNMLLNFQTMIRVLANYGREMIRAAFSR